MQTDITGVIIGVLGILIGIWVSYYYYKKSLRIKEPTWGIHSNNLIRNQASTVPDLKVLFKDDSVNDLTISRVVFWNNGSETILKQDLGTINPLQISAVGDVKLLETKIIMFNNQSNRFFIRETDNKKSAFIEFDYLDNLQGGVIQVIHTGTSSQDIAVGGDIIGVKSLQQVNLPPIWDISRTPRKRSFISNPQVQYWASIFLLSLLFTGIGVVIVLVSLDYIYNLIYNEITFLIFFVFLPSLALAFQARKLFFQKPTPAGLESYLAGLLPPEKP